MFPQFVQYLVHLKRGQDRLDEHRRFDRSAWNTQFLLSQHKDIVPKACLQVILQLGQVEVGTGASLQQQLDVVEEVQPKIEQPAGDLFTIDEHVLLRQMPAARAHEQCSSFLL